MSENRANLVKQIEQLKAEKHHFKSLKDKYERIIDNTASVLYRCAIDEHWTIFYINNEIEALTGYPASDFINNNVRNYASIVHQNDCIHTERMILEAIQRKESFLIEYRLLAATGKEIRVFEKGRAEYDESGKAKWLDGVVVGIGDLVTSEASLHQAQVQNRLILEGVAEGIVGLNADGRCTFINSSGLEMLGYDYYEIVGKLFSQFSTIESDTVIQKNNEAVFTHKNGKRFPVEFTISEIDTNRNDERLRVIAFNDITTHKQVEHELRSAKESAEAASKAKSVFLSKMSHELRTPLNAILGFSEMMARDLHIGQKQQDELTIINRNGRYLLSLINRVLDMSKIEAGHSELELEPVDLHHLLTEIGEMFKPKAEVRNLQFNLFIEAVLFQYLLLDKSKITQVIINLLDNAISFTEAGSVILRAEVDELTDGRKQLKIGIEDTGIGIPSDKINTVFETFNQASHNHGRQQSTGLGLTIARQFVHLMKGTIEVESTPDFGSNFRFKIPAAIAESDELEQSKYSKSLNDQRIVSLANDEPEWRILIVEDQADNRLLLCRLLEQVGFKVHNAVNGEEAIQQFKICQPHFIWMDLRMPVMNGYDATSNIRRLPGGSGVKIVAITASIYKEQRQKILQAGCDEVLHKPLQTTEIYEAMAAQLGLNYTYDEDTNIAQAEETPELTSEMISTLPDDLILALKNASQALDSVACTETIERFPDDHAEIADGLQQLVDNFRYGEILDLLNDAGGCGKD